MSLEDQSRKCGVLADAVGRYTLTASATEDRDAKRAALMRAFTSYGLLTRAMSQLEQLAPNCAAEGLREAAKVHDIIDARAA